ncbi:MAG: Crp/Fnr family transcriptional regulator [Pseudomonadota bacterium]
MTFQELLAEHGRALQCEQGQYLFRQGDDNRALYLLKGGLLKAYYLSADGKENIKSFLVPGDTIGSLKGVFSESGCSFNLVCLEQSELVRIDFDIVYSHSRDNLALAREMLDFLLKFAMKKETREFELLCLPPEERYRRLLETTPRLFDQVTQNDIARYLGVTPVGLSRIKKRVQGTG